METAESQVRLLIERLGVYAGDEQNESNFQHFAGDSGSAGAVFVETIFQQ